VTTPDGKRLRYAEIADDIRERLRASEIEPGSRVGTFSSLGKDYGVAIGTINKALDVLRAEGTVVTVAGKGIFVADHAVPGPAPAAGNGDRLSEQLDALREEVRRLAVRLDAAEAQSGLVAELRETVASLQAQVMDLYHSMGQPYPYEQGAPKQGRKAV
jgi:DNA-binding GntR family transcriptional regulator